MRSLLLALSSLLAATAASASSPPVALPIAGQCGPCGMCLTDRGWTSDRPEGLLPTPASGSVAPVRAVGLLVEDRREDGGAEWAVLLGPYVAGGGHRALAAEYRRRADAAGRTDRRIRWGGEADLSWNDRCLLVTRFNETSGMLAGPEAPRLGIPYAPLPLSDVASVLGRMLSPWCQRHGPAPEAIAFREDAAHLSEAFNALLASAPTKNVRHDLANLQMRLYGSLYAGSSSSAAEIQEETRTIAEATRAFLVEAKTSDPRAWEAIPAALATATMRMLDKAAATGWVTLAELDQLIEVMGHLGNFRAALEIRVPAETAAGPRPPWSLRTGGP